MVDEVTALFHDLHRPLLRYTITLGLSTHDGEDVVQEAFLALFRHLRQGRSRSNLRGWTFRVVHNLALKRRAASKQGNHASLSPLMESRAADPSPDPEQQIALDRQRSKIQTVLRALSEKDRCCLNLRAEGLRYREIASILDISLGAVALSLSRSIDRLGRAVSG